MDGIHANACLQSIREAELQLMRARSVANYALMDNKTGEYDLDSHHCTKVLSGILYIIESVDNYLSEVEARDIGWAMRKASEAYGLEELKAADLSDLCAALTKETSNGKDNNSGQGSH